MGEQTASTPKKQEEPTEKRAPKPQRRSTPARRKVQARVARVTARAEKAHEASVGASNFLRTELPGQLVAENALERTSKLRQPVLLKQVDQGTRSKASFQLDLSASNLTPYNVATYSRSGKAILVASQRGHVAVSTWRSATLHFEMHLNETIRDGVFLHNELFIALAQKKHCYIYDGSGTQVHVLRKHREPGKLAFLPHHFLLASASAPVSESKQLTYTDTSTGQLVADLPFGSRTHNLGNVMDLCVNRSSGVLNMAHSNGVVSLWSPMQNSPLAQMFVHPGGVAAVDATIDGTMLVTAGFDRTVRVWDLRTYKELERWRLASKPAALSVSQRGMVAVGFGATVMIWPSTTMSHKAMTKRQAVASAFSGRTLAREPYMSEQYAKRSITGLDFCPFEDVLAVGHDSGMASMVVPGAGEAVFDSTAPNPYQTSKERREAEIRGLLDKLRPETIALDVNYIGGVDRDPAARLEEMRGRIREEQLAKKADALKKKRAKGRSKISKQLKRKQSNVIDAKRVALQSRLEEERRKKREESGDTTAVDDESSTPAALHRFVKRKPAAV